MCYAEGMGVRSEHHKKQVMLFYEELWDKQRLNLIPRVLADELTFRGSLGTEFTGTDQFARYVEVVTAGLGDYRSDVRSLVAEPGAAAARLVFSGTHRGALPGVAPTPTGRRLVWAGAAWFRFAEDGRINDVWVLGDTESFYRQVRA